MADRLTRTSGDNDNNILAASQVIIPARKEQGRKIPPAGPHVVGVGEHGRDSPTPTRQQVRVSDRDVAFSLQREFDGCTETRTLEPPRKPGLVHIFPSRKGAGAPWLRQFSGPGRWGDAGQGMGDRIIGDGRPRSRDGAQRRTSCQTGEER